MMTLTVKMNRRKLVIFVIIAIAVILGALIFCFRQNDDKAVSVQYILSDNTNDERIKFLNSYGWQTESEPTEVRDILIPEEFSDVYEDYNNIQIAQGCDLAEYKGNLVKKYTYKITNYPLADSKLEGTVYANLLVYQSEIIGGDVSSVALDGFMHGFSMP